MYEPARLCAKSESIAERQRRGCGIEDDREPAHQLGPHHRRRPGEIAAQVVPDQRGVRLAEGADDAGDVEREVRGVVTPRACGRCRRPRADPSRPRGTRRRRARSAGAARSTRTAGSRAAAAPAARRPSRRCGSARRWPRRRGGSRASSPAGDVEPYGRGGCVSGTAVECRSGRRHDGRACHSLDGRRSTGRGTRGCGLTLLQYGRGLLGRGDGLLRRLDLLELGDGRSAPAGPRAAGTRRPRSGTTRRGPRPRLWMPYAAAKLSTGSEKSASTPGHDERARRRSPPRLTSCLSSRLGQGDLVVHQRGHLGGRRGDQLAEAAVGADRSPRVARAVAHRCLPRRLLIRVV